MKTQKTTKTEKSGIETQVANKNLYYSKKDNSYNYNILNFRAEEDILIYLKKSKLNKAMLLSKFLNRAVRFYIMWLEKPEKILFIAKQRYNELYKWVLRKNYKVGDIGF